MFHEDDGMDRTKKDIVGAQFSYISNLPYQHPLLPNVFVGRSTYSRFSWSNYTISTLLIIGFGHALLAGDGLERWCFWVLDGCLAARLVF